MKRILLLLVCLFALAGYSRAGSISVQQVILQNWNDTRTNVELWVFADQSFIAADGTPYLSGNLNNRVAVQRVTGLTMSLSHSGSMRA